MPHGRGYSRIGRSPKNLTAVLDQTENTELTHRSFPPPTWQFALRPHVTNAEMFKEAGCAPGAIPACYQIACGCT